MRLSLILTTFAFMGVATARFDQDFTYLDLQPKANHELKEPLGTGNKGNDLAELPQGDKKLADVPFRIGKSMIQLASTRLESKPARVEGIKVGQAFTKLHILHATCWGSGPEGSSNHAADGTKIGEFIVNYADKTKETIPIVYGEDVRDWWENDESKKLTRAKEAWTGENEVTKRADRKIHLYRMTWKNPHPDKTVASIDCASTNDTVAAPFCVAMTAEGE